eukprot:m.976091 g.976091  ORF g.976091 m.976091 type:complete len:1185 (+) comp23944_c0_seq9:242-3796(+)
MEESSLDLESVVQAGGASQHPVVFSLEDDDAAKSCDPTVQTDTSRKPKKKKKKKKANRNKTESREDGGENSRRSSGNSSLYDGLESFWTSAGEDERLRLTSVRVMDLLKTVTDLNKLPCSCEECLLQRDAYEEELSDLYIDFLDDLSVLDVAEEDGFGYPSWMVNGALGSTTCSSARNVDNHHTNSPARRSTRPSAHDQSSVPDPPYWCDFLSTLVCVEGQIGLSNTVVHNSKVVVNLLARLDENRRRLLAQPVHRIDCPDDDSHDALDDILGTSGAGPPEQYALAERVCVAKRMFYVIAWNMMAQDIMHAYREKVALDNQNALIAEEEAEAVRAAEKERQRDAARERKKLKRQRQREARLIEQHRQEEIDLQSQAADNALQTPLDGDHDCTTGEDAVNVIPQEKPALLVDETDTCVPLPTTRTPDTAHGDTLATQAPSEPPVATHASIVSAPPSLDSQPGTCRSDTEDTGITPPRAQTQSALLPTPVETTTSSTHVRGRANGTATPGRRTHGGRAMRVGSSGASSNPPSRSRQQKNPSGVRGDGSEYIRTPVKATQMTPLGGTREAPLSRTPPPTEQRSVPTLLQQHQRVAISRRRLQHSPQGTNTPSTTARSNLNRGGRPATRAPSHAGERVLERGKTSAHESEKTRVHERDEARVHEQAPVSMRTNDKRKPKRVTTGTRPKIPSSAAGVDSPATVAGVQGRAERCNPATYHVSVPPLHSGTPRTQKVSAIDRLDKPTLQVSPPRQSAPVPKSVHDVRTRHDGTHIPTTAAGRSSALTPTAMQQPAPPWLGHGPSLARQGGSPASPHTAYVPSLLPLPTVHSSQNFRTAPPVTARASTAHDTRNGPVGRLDGSPALLSHRAVTAYATASTWQPSAAPQMGDGRAASAYQYGGADRGVGGNSAWHGSAQGGVEMHHPPQRHEALVGSRSPMRGMHVVSDGAHHQSPQSRHHRKHVTAGMPQNNWVYGDGDTTAVPYSHGYQPIASSPYDRGRNYAVGDLQPSQARTTGFVHVHSETWDVHHSVQTPTGTSLATVIDHSYHPVDSHPRTADGVYPSSQANYIHTSAELSPTHGITANTPAVLPIGSGRRVPAGGFGAHSDAAPETHAAATVGVTLPLDHGGSALWSNSTGQSSPHRAGIISKPRNHASDLEASDYNNASTSGPPWMTMAADLGDIWANPSEEYQ